MEHKVWELVCNLCWVRKMFSAGLGKQVCLLWNFYVRFEMFAWAFYGFSGTELSQKMVYMKIFAFEQSST